MSTPGQSTTITFACSSCSKKFSVQKELAGQLAKCPCGQLLQVPTVSQANVSQLSPAPPPLPAGKSSDESKGFFKKIRNQGVTLAKDLLRKGQDAYEQVLQDAYAADSITRFEIGESMILGRDEKTCQLVLDTSRVSRRHTKIQRVKGDYLVADLGSSAGTYLNGTRLQQTARLTPGDTLNIGPYSFTYDGQALVTETTSNQAELLCSHLSREVLDRTNGEPIKILNDISLLIQPREFTVIIGPSGGGKSTLLNALSARQPATSGIVLLNGQNLYTHFDAIKKNMALVPQKDVLHNELRLRHALLYTAKLRLPPDLGEEGYRKVVDEYLETVDLSDRGSTSIKNLSGGQVKRASLANEIISEPNLLFVDEATSGLDEHTDHEIMQIFRRIAEAGKTVLCITHNLTNVEKSCHKVVILAPGGYLAFVGTPTEAKEYFEIQSLGDVYNRLRSKPAQSWQQKFANTSACQQMQNHIQSRVANSSSDVEKRLKQPFMQLFAIFLRQFLLLFRRGLEVQLSDVKSLLMMGVQCLFIASLICVLFGEIPGILDPLGKRGPFAARVLFLLTISGFWFGCNNAAKEIVKEKEIYERERDVCLNVISYYAAKFLLLGLITTLQIVALLAIVRSATELPASFLPQLCSLTLIGICGVATGLLISTISSNTDMAVTLVPVAIIPQVILAGVIWQVEGFAKLLSQLFVSCYWGYGNVVSTIPAAATASGFEDWNYWGSGVFLLFHITILVLAANAILYSIDKRLSLQGTGIDDWVNNARQVLHGVMDTVAKPTANDEASH